MKKKQKGGKKKMTEEDESFCKFNMNFTKLNAIDKSIIRRKSTKFSFLLPSVTISSKKKENFCVQTHLFFLKDKTETRGRKSNKMHIDTEIVNFPIMQFDISLVHGKGNIPETKFDIIMTNNEWSKKARCVLFADYGSQHSFSVPFDLDISNFEVENQVFPKKDVVPGLEMQYVNLILEIANRLKRSTPDYDEERNDLYKRLRKIIDDDDDNDDDYIEEKKDKDIANQSSEDSKKTKQSEESILLSDKDIEQDSFEVFFANVFN